MTAHPFERAVAEVEDWTLLAAVYREEARLAANPRRAARHLLEVGRIHEEHLGDPDAAREAYAEAHRLDPADVASLRGARRLSLKTGELESARSLCEAELTQGGSEADRASAHLRLAGLQGGPDGDGRSERHHLERAAELDPDDPEALLRLELLIPEDDAEARDELLELRLRGAESDEARTPLLLDLARRAEARPDGLAVAERRYREALDATPGERVALQGLIRLHLASDRTGELIALLKHRVTQVTDQDFRGRLMYLSAVLMMARGEQLERVPLMLGQAAVLLSHDATVIRELVADYESLAMWGPANALLEAQAAQEGGLAGALSLYRAGLNTEVGLGNATQALEFHRRAISVAPDFAPAHAAIRRLASRLGDLEMTRAAVSALAEGAEDPATRAELLVHAAELCETSPQSTPAERMGAWQSALAAAARCHVPLLDGPAIAAMRRLLATAGAHAELARTLEDWLGLSLDREARRIALTSLALTREVHLDDPVGASLALSQLLEHIPDDVPALRSLQRLCALAGDIAGVISAAEREQACPIDADRKRALLVRIAELHESVGEPRRAEEAFKRAIELDGRFVPAVAGLGRLLHDQARWPELLALHQDELNHLGPDEPERAGILGRIAELWELRLSNPVEAAACHEAVLALRPRAPDALAALERLYDGPERVADLARILRHRLAHTEPARERAVLHYRLGVLLHEALGDPSGAAQHLDAAFELAPTLAPLPWAMVRLHLETGDHARLALLLRGFLERADVPGNRAVRAHMLAAILPGEEARQVYLDRLAHGAVDAYAAWWLFRDAGRRGDGTEVAVRLSRLAQWVNDRRDALLLWREAAESAEVAVTVQAGELRQALWERVLALDPGAEQAWEGLHRLRRAAGDAAEFAGFLLSLGRAAVDDRTASTARWSAAMIYDRIGGEDPLALYREAALASGDDPVPVWLLLTAAERAGLARDQAELQIALAARRRSQPAASAELTQAGQFFLQSAATVGERAHGVSCLLEAVRRDPLADDAARHAEAALLEDGQLEALVALFGRRTMAIETPEDLRPMARRLAAAALGDPALSTIARPCLDRLVERLPDEPALHFALGELSLSEGRAVDPHPSLAPDEADRGSSESILVTDPSAAPLPLKVAAAALLSSFPPPPGPTPPESDPAGIHSLGFAPTGPQPIIVLDAEPPPRRSASPPPEFMETATFETLVLPPKPSAPQATAPRSPAPLPPPVAGNPTGVPPPAPTASSSDIRHTVPYGLQALPLPPGPIGAPPPPVAERGPPSAPPPRRTIPGSQETEMGMAVTRTTPGRPDAPAAAQDPVLWVRAARTRIEADPLDLAAWRELVRATSQRGHVAAARWYGDALSWLEGQVETVTPAVPPGPLPDGLRRPLLPPTVPAAVLMLLRQVGPLVSPPFCSDAGRHGVTAADLVGDDDPLMSIGRRMAAILGVDTWMLLRNPSRPYTVAVEAGDPSSVVLGSAILDGTSDPARSFLLARCLVPLGEGTLLARKLTDREFGAFLAALLGLLGAESPVRARDRATYDRMRAQLEPSLPDERRTPQLLDLARASAQSLTNLPAAALRAGLETYAARLALAITDGCGGALEMLRRQDFDDRPRSGLNRADLVQFMADSDVARDLLVFAGSPACEAIRSWLAGER